MTTRCAVVGLALIASVGCDQIDPVSGPDPTPAPVTNIKPPPTAGTGPLQLFDLPTSLRWKMAAVPGHGSMANVAANETIPAEYQLPPEINSWFVSVSFGGTSTFSGYASMTFYANWAQQDLELRIYNAGALLAHNRWTETGSSIWPKQSGAFTAGSLNAGVSCGASGNGNSSHAAEVRLYTSQAWTTLARVHQTDSDVAIQDDCPPPPNCELKPQTSVSTSARFRGHASGAVTASDFEQCSDPVPPGGGSADPGEGGYVCYEVWLVYPDTGVEIYLGTVCYEEYAT